MNFTFLSQMECYCHKAVTTSYDIEDMDSQKMLKLRYLQVSQLQLTYFEGLLLRFVTAM